MRRGEIPDTRPQRPVVWHLRQAGFDPEPEAYGWWVGRDTSDGRFVVYQPESPQEEAGLERRSRTLGLLRLACEPRAVAYGAGRRCLHA